MNKLWIILLSGLLVACGGQSSTESTDETDQMETVTEEVNIKGEEVSYSTDSTTMNGYIAYNENATEKMPGVIVVHEWWGHNEYVRKRADMLAELGYVALAVDMYGDGKQAAHPQDAAKFSGMVMSNLEVAKARFDQALATLKSNPNVDTEKIAAIGYCFGGSVVLTMANAGYDLDAVAAFHSGLGLPVMPGPDLKAKVIVMNGADDPFVPAEQVAKFNAAMDSAQADYKYIAYEGAVHAYTSPGADSLGQKFELPLAYNKEADEKSWAELQEFFNTVF
jgi:dienelactone hydrolase